MPTTARRAGAFLFAGFSILLLAPLSGPANPPALPAAARAGFEKNVLPILRANCQNCHNPTKHKGSLDLTSLEKMRAGGGSGEVFVPGFAKESLLFQLIQEDGAPHMPPKKQLAAAEIKAIGDWIDSLPKPSQPAGERMITEKDRQHWAFRPLTKPAPPGAEGHPIDAFLELKRREQGLRSVGPATKQELIRRATYDLTGLPPTPEEVQTFVKDEAADAYERLLDRLLESPAYGERWGRFWLDLARYADSDGFEFDVDRPHAFRYRDYVIKSMNADKPYNRFILEQLAGDELFPHKPEAQVATGFCRNGPTIDNQQSEKNRLDELDDIVSTTSSVFLGLTLGCARCHDHKYDPISQKDYYEMLAIFNSREKILAPVGTPEERQAYRARREIYDAELKQLRDELSALTPSAQRFAGEWRIERNELVQEAIKPDVRLFFGDPNWTDYIVELEAKRTGGQEGFLIAVRASSPENFYWVHFGGWGNRSHGVEIEVDGQRKLAAPLKPGSVDNDKWHRIRLAVIGQNLKAFLDDELIFDLAIDKHEKGGVGLGAWSTQNRFRNLRIRSLDGETLHAGLPRLANAEKLDPETERTRRERRSQIQKQIADLEKTKPQPLVAPAIRDGSRTPRKTHLLLRGDHRTPAAEVQPNIPAVLRLEPLAFDQEGPSSKTTGRRSVLAKWLASPENPLTARVMANRVWQLHFHRGLVETPSNFGRNGSAPSHPELLDWLAGQFIDNGWRLKPLHKLIMTSAAYRQATTLDQEQWKKDPEDVFYWRFAPKRLEAEAIRDSMLFASGKLNPTMFGPGVKPRIHPSIIATGSTPKWPVVDKEGPEHWRRSVYVFIKRSVLHPLMEGFDAPTATQSCEKRLHTTVPTQALMLLNNEFVGEQARFLAERVRLEAGDDAGKQIDRAFWLTLCRAPTAKERDLALDFLKTQPLADFCHVLFNLNEFVYFS